MKILYVCRAYSGFEESLKAGIWSPKGAPTIARMLSTLDASNEHDLHIILTQKGNTRLANGNVKLRGLETPITLLTGQASLPSWLWKFREKFADIYQLYKIWQITKSIRPDIVYCDRVNILPAAILSRFTRNRVIWRVMGVLENMHKASNSNTLRARLSKWLWRSPFRAVICTLDGSGGGPWLNRVLRPDVPKHIMINGIEKNTEPDEVLSFPKDHTKMLFVGRLESLKGVEEFLHGFYEAAKTNKKLSAVIAGDGSLKSKLIQDVSEKGLHDRVHFLGSITPAPLKYTRQNCDFYVSLNKQGNLSNTNLESLSDGLPAIIPTSNSQTGVDIDTDKLVPHNTFYRFGKVGDQMALVKAIHFMANAENRRLYHKNALACAKEILPTWQERIDQELSIFKNIRNDQCNTALVIADLGSGGAQKVAVSLAKDLSDQGKKIALITLSGSNNDFFELPEAVQRIALNVQSNSQNGIQSIASNIKRIRAIRRALKNLAPTQTISFIAPTNILTIAATRFIKTRLLISERNDPMRQSFGRLWDTLRQISYRFADTVTANSPNAINAMRPYVPNHKLHYIPNALAQPKEQHHVKHGQKENIILNVGRLHPQKAHHVLIDAFAQCHNKYPDWKLIIAGDGPLKKELQNQIQTLNLQDHIQLMGVVDTPYTLYKRARIFAFPSLHEGTPNALLEAMSCGLAPIISNTCEGALPYLTHEESGLITNVDNVQSLADAMMRLMIDKVLCEKIGQNAHRSVAPLFTKSTADLWAEALTSAGEL